MGKPSVRNAGQYAGLITRMNSLIEKRRVSLFLCLVLLSAFLRNISHEVTLFLFTLWAGYLLIPIWVYAESNQSRPLFRYMGYFICWITLILIIAACAFLLLSHFRLIGF